MKIDCIDFINYYISDNITVGFYCPIDPSRIINGLELIIEFPCNNEGILCTTQKVNNNEYDEKKNHYNYDSLVLEIKNVLEKINEFYYESNVCDIMSELSMN
jgi:hypothetical protein